MTSVLHVSNVVEEQVGAGGVDELGVCDIDESVLVSAVLKEVSVEAGLLHGLGVQSVDLLPVLGARLVLVDEAEEVRLVALLGDELVDEDGAEEGADGEERSGLEGQVKSAQASLPLTPSWKRAGTVGDVGDGRRCGCFDVR